ncbi:guanine deaminase [Gayadomonas joobiniege]|uniref:guanine deaminase n=1 Tax=Gayadomonas joobiniege TaxID=1234606 RepID=UPI000368B817|nr:guanine deaminase [Gayadomonas joobiniege]
MSKYRLILGDMLDLIADPSEIGDAAVRLFSPGALLLKDGHVLKVGLAEQLKAEYADILESENCPIDDHSGCLVVPGFIDTHIHYPQTEMIAAYGEQLLTWLEKYAFPTEQKFSSREYASKISELFLQQLIKHGTTTAMVFGTVHPESVDAFFNAAAAKNLRMICGKVLMDRNCPDELSDCAESGYQDSKLLIEKWHGKKRLSYAVTPRFAPTSSPEQLARCQQLLAEYPSVYLQTHLSENERECNWVRQLYPQYEDYLAVYEAYDLVKKRSIFAHGIHLKPREYHALAEKGGAISHCPTSNLFIGSGLFNLGACHESKIKLGMGTDVGGGSSFSMLQTFNEAYKIQQLKNYKMSAFDGLYLATLGGAKALDLEHTLGNFMPGKEADFVVFDEHSDPFIRFRMAQCTSLHERLFSLMMLADDRQIKETYIMGQKLKSQWFPSNSKNIAEAC